MVPIPGHLKPSARRRRRRSTSHSPPRHRLSDDLLSQLTPATAVEALREPTGSLKTCLDSAAPIEQAFVTRTAIMSKKIWEWLDELSEWSWPAGGGSEGFEMPLAKRRKLSSNDSSPRGGQQDESGSLGGDHMGSLTAFEVAQYERRISTIQQQMDGLDLEEIKRHVLHNHIMPLSRPGTPMSQISNPSATSSLQSYNKMEDLTAVITAIVIQALPNLSKLTRLMNIWSTRLIVLRKVPPLLIAIADAEIALQSGWNAISATKHESEDAQNESKNGGDGNVTSDLTRNDFEVIKHVLEKKVVKPGRSLDFMLDCLEGLEDTLPDEWLDRLEAVERDYGEWAAAGERKVRETEWSRLASTRLPAAILQKPSPANLDAGDSDDGLSPAKHALPVVDNAVETVTLPVVIKVEPATEYPEAAVKEEQSSTRDVVVPEEGRDTLGSIVQDPTITTHERELSPYDGSDDVEGEGGISVPRTRLTRQTPEPDLHPISEEISVNGDELSQNANHRDVPLPTVEEEEPHAEDENDVSLPPPLATRSRSISEVSQGSVLVHGPASLQYEPSSDLRELSASPELPRFRDPEDRYVSPGLSPPSSPPMRASFRGASASPMLLATHYEEDSIPQTPLDSSFIDDMDDAATDVGSPSKSRSNTLFEDQLHKRLNEVIESIAISNANIKLSAQPSPINLNPPPLELPTAPRMKRPSKDPIRRSASSLSSRAPTPSFTLAPAYAKNARPRAQRGQQETKVYHLTRSTGEAPIKLLIRLVGEHGERVMVRVGGGWADLGEYLKDYASHHGRRSTGGDATKVEIKDLPRVSTTRGTTSSPPSRPASALEFAPMTPLNVQKSRRSFGAGDELRSSTTSRPALQPKTPAAAEGSNQTNNNTPSSDASTRSRSSSRVSWGEDESSVLGLAGPTGRKVEMSEESRAWVESVKEKVRLASGERKVSEGLDARFGEINKVGGTKRLFRKT
jgi:hypothetical protein